MDSPGFTQKKFETLSLPGQHRHLLKWLTSFYQSVTSNRLTPKSYDLFTVQYQKMLTWSRMKPFERPASARPREWIERLSDRIHYHRIEAGITPTDHQLLAPAVTLDRSAPACLHAFDLQIALDGIRSLFNAGAIIRTGEAAGFSSVILGNMPDRSHPALKKTAMGADQWIRVENTQDLARTLMKKKKAGFQVVGVETLAQAVPIQSHTWQDKTVLVFGNEEYGISAHVLSVCDDVVQIPVFGRKNSINVGHAASVACFQAAMALGVNR